MKLKGFVSVLLATAAALFSSVAAIAYSRYDDPTYCRHVVMAQPELVCCQGNAYNDPSMSLVCCNGGVCNAKTGEKVDPSSLSLAYIRNRENARRGKVSTTRSPSANRQHRLFLPDEAEAVFAVKSAVKSAKTSTYQGGYELDPNLYRPRRRG